MNNDQLKTFLLIKYDSIDLALMHWLTNPKKFTDEEDEYLEQYSKHKFPNLNLIGSGVDRSK